MIEIIRAGLEARSMKDVFKFYALNLSLLLPIIIVIYSFWGDAFFTILPVVVVALVGILYFLRYKDLLVTRKILKTLRYNATPLVLSIAVSLTLFVLIQAFFYHRLVSTAPTESVYGHSGLHIFGESTSTTYLMIIAILIIICAIFYSFLSKQGRSIMPVILFTFYLTIGLFFLMYSQFGGYERAAYDADLNRKKREHIILLLDETYRLTAKDREAMFERVKQDTISLLRRGPEGKDKELSIWITGHTSPSPIAKCLIPGKRHRFSTGAKEPYRQYQRAEFEKEYIAAIRKYEELLSKTLHEHPLKAQTPTNSSVYYSLLEGIARIQSGCKENCSIYVYSDLNERVQPEIIDALLSKLGKTSKLPKPIDNRGVEVSFCLDEESMRKAARIKEIWKSLFTYQDLVSFNDCKL